MASKIYMTTAQTAELAKAIAQGLAATRNLLRLLSIPEVHIILLMKLLNIPKMQLRRLQCEVIV